ncbi:MAG: tetratricopeptide repeat protein [Pyrinomonadaceae bacterium]
MRRYLQPPSVIVIVLLALFACASVGARAQRRATHPKPTPTPTPQPTPKKKLPPGAKGFEQYAGRDASDKLVTGAATRGPINPINTAQGEFDEGMRQYKAHALTRAAAAFTQAVKLAPGWAEAHYSLAIVLNELDRWAEAVAEFQRALDANPDEHIRLLATYNQGNAQLDLGQYDKALAAFQQTTQLAPEQPTPHYNMGLAYLGLKQDTQAVAQFKEATQLKPDYAEAYYNLGVIYLRQGHKDEARAEQQRLTKLDTALARRLAALLK